MEGRGGEAQGVADPQKKCFGPLLDVVRRFHWNCVLITLWEIKMTISFPRKKKIHIYINGSVILSFESMT
jgi:hypothetical protein